MNELINKIKGYGYWRVLIRPNKFGSNLISSLAEARKIIEDSKIELRGWDYPHSDRELKAVSADSIESVCDWKEGPAYEYWRYFLSGQFVHYFAMREDCRIDATEAEKIKARISFGEGKLEGVKLFFSVLSTLYTFTEIFFFASRLAQNGYLGEESIHLEIELNKVNGRMLFVGSERSLHRPYICHFQDDKFVINLDVTRADLIENHAKMSLDNVLKVFESFGWEKPNREIFEDDQRKFLERRL